MHSIANLVWSYERCCDLEEIACSYADHDLIVATVVFGDADRAKRGLHNELRCHPNIERHFATIVDIGRDQMHRCEVVHFSSFYFLMLADY